MSLFNFKFLFQLKAKPTTNGYLCQIPYFFDNQFQYHCLARTEYDCFTTNSQFSTCSFGDFLFILYLNAGFIKVK